MDIDPNTMYISGLILSFLVSLFFSAIKTVFHSTDKNSIPADKEKLRYLAIKIEDITKSKTYFATVVSFGKTFSNIAFAIFSFCLTRDLFPHFRFYQVLIVSVAFSSVVLSVFAYTLPHVLALCYYQSLMPFFHNLFYLFNVFFYAIAKPISSLHNLLLKLFRYDEKLAFLSEEEKSRLNESTDHEEPLDQEEKEMIRSIFELGETTVNEIMVPRIDIKALEINTDFQTACNTIRQVGHSRIPVFKENIDSIVGILYAKDILGWISENPEVIPEDQWNLASLIKTPLFVPSNKKIDDLMSELKKHHIHLVIVVDEYGGTAGIVTMEDILEEIVGEIQDEYDSEEEPVKEIGENTYLVKPHIELDDLEEILDITIDHEDEEYNTLSGLFYHEYGDVPKENTEFDYNGLKLKILKMDNQRIEKLELTVLKENGKVEDKEKEF